MFSGRGSIAGARGIEQAKLLISCRQRYNKMTEFTMTTQEINKRWVKRRDQWLALVENLLGEVSQWALAQDWSIHRDQKEIREDPIGLYSAPTLRIRLPGGEVHVEPVALRIVGSKSGRVDIE